MKSLHVCAVLLLTGLIGCRWMFTRDRIHEQHRFASGDLLTCDSWIEQGFQSRVGRTMQCWIESPGSWFKEYLFETWLSTGEGQPDGPNMLQFSGRLELHRSGASAALLMDNALVYKRPDLQHQEEKWWLWHMADDQWLKVFLRAVTSAAEEQSAQSVPSVGKKTAQQVTQKRAAETAPKNDTGRPGKPSEPWRLYRIAAVDLPSLRVLAALQPGPGRAWLPSKLVFRPRRFGPELNLNVEETLAANPGLRVAEFPPDVVFEVKAAETVDGKTRILRRDILESLPDYQTLTQDYRFEDGSTGHLTLTLKPAFRIGDVFVYCSRSYGLPDADPMETKLGEWNSAGGMGSPTMEKHSGAMYVRCIHRGQESPPDEVPVVKPYNPFPQ
jgi:hypothetical protein